MTPFIFRRLATTPDTMYYSFEVMTPSGNRVFPKSDMPGGSMQSYTLDTGKRRERVFSFHISAICKFDEIGTYVINVTRVVGWPGGKQSGIAVVSNPLSIKIVSDK